MLAKSRGELIFGVLRCTVKINLAIKMYEKLFGGFEDLTLTCVEDEEEEDELENIPKSMKTKKGGYLKDGFVVDSSDAEDEEVVGHS